MSRANTCPECGALPGKQCLSGTGRLKDLDHAKRDDGHMATLRAKAKTYNRALHLRRRSS